MDMQTPKGEPVGAKQLNNAGDQTRHRSRQRRIYEFLSEVMGFNSYDEMVAHVSANYPKVDVEQGLEDLYTKELAKQRNIAQDKWVERLKSHPEESQSLDEAFQVQVR